MAGNLLFQKLLPGVVAFPSLSPLNSGSPSVWYSFYCMSSRDSNFYFGEKNYFSNEIQMEHGCPPPGQKHEHVTSVHHLHRTQGMSTLNIKSATEHPSIFTFLPSFRAFYALIFLACACSRELTRQVGHGFLLSSF